MCADAGGLPYIATYDTGLWNSRQKLHLFVEKVEQGDGEGIKETPPQMIAVLEWQPHE